MISEHHCFISLFTPSGQSPCRLRDRLTANTLPSTNCYFPRLLWSSKLTCRCFQSLTSPPRCGTPYPPRQSGHQTRPQKENKSSASDMWLHQGAGRTREFHGLASSRWPYRAGETIYSLRRGLLWFDSNHCISLPHTHTHTYTLFFIHTFFPYLCGPLTCQLDCYN